MKDLITSVSSNSYYICSCGRLYIFDNNPYQHSYKNQSIRSISNDLTETYSGIYLKGKKLSDPVPTFTDSYVRQIGKRGFICSHSLSVLEKVAINTGNLQKGGNFCIYNEPDNLLVSDIISTPDGRYYYVSETSAQSHNLLNQ